MLEHIGLLRNVGQFDNVATGAHLDMARATVIYAENGRGKTTLAAIMRSVAAGDATLLSERHRLAANHPPHVVLDFTGGAARVFQNGAWSATFPDIAVFDDHFVSANVCSGIEIGADHRQNLHELILGEQGVALNAELKRLVDQIEAHNREIRLRGDAIPAAARQNLSVDAFCALEPDAEVDEKIAETERTVAAAQSAEAVRQEAGFVSLTLPAIDSAQISRVLATHLPDIEEDTVARVHQHVVRLGERGEAWLQSGMNRIGSVSEGLAHEACPFCNQDLGGSTLINHYRAYFSEGYRGFLATLETEMQTFEATHSGNAIAGFERAVRVAVERARFWAPFARIPAIDLDTAEIARRWNAAIEAVSNRYRLKRASPLEQVVFSDEDLNILAGYEEIRGAVATLSEALLAANEVIALAKERALAGNVVALTADLSRYRAIKERHSARIAPLCEAVIAEKNRKSATERAREQARTDLDTYRQQVFPAYEQAINDYLRRFGAGFRLGSVISVNIRGGSSCTYNVVIGDTEVPVTNDTPGTPSFRTTLSAGDRNALALAFFFASLDRDQNLGRKIVVIDDPMTSLDEHRSLTTVTEVRRLADRVEQVIVLSHSKPFVAAVWNGSDRIARSAMKISRAANGSTLAGWDVTADLVTDHDRRHALVRRFLAGEQGLNEREVAAALRPMLEASSRVGYPEHFPPGTLLGPFIEVCERRLQSNSPILSREDIDELTELKDYGNLFHHDSNLQWETQVINDQQLVQFAQRTIAFIKRR